MPTDQPLFRWFEQLQQSDPARTAWLTTDSRLDYRTLYRQTEYLAACCTKAGLKPGQPLAAVCRSRQQLGRAALLAMYLGCPLLPLKPQRESFLPLLESCRIDQIVTDEAVDYAGYRCFPIHAGKATHAHPTCPPQPLNGDQTQLLIATSGSSGSAHVTRHSGDGLCASVLSSQSYTALNQRDVWLNCLPMHHIGGFAILLRCLHAGAAMLIEESFDAAHILDDLQRFTVTHLSLVPAMLAGLLAAQGNIPLPDSLRCVLVGGGPLSPELAHRALAQGWPLTVSWGMSETASHATLCRVDSNWTSGMAGKPVSGCRLEIVDQRGQTVTGRGYIRIHGPMLMQGYCHRDSAIDNGIKEGYFTSSDTGYLDAEGNLHLCGRADYQLNSGGYTIDPEALEAQLHQCAGIGQVAVTGIKDITWGDRLLLLFTGPATTQTVAQWCQDHLDSRVRPRQVIKTAHLPCTGSGKLDRPALARLAAQLTA